MDGETERGVGVGETERAGVGMKLEAVEESSSVYSMTRSLWFW